MASEVLEQTLMHMVDIAARHSRGVCLTRGHNYELTQPGTRRIAHCSRLKSVDAVRVDRHLVANADGVYHSAEFNDRLVLGLKGAMGEADCTLSGPR
jgi:hypothetical protein